MEAEIIHVADASAGDGEQVDGGLLSQVVRVDRNEWVEHLALLARGLVAGHHVVARLVAVPAFQRGEQSWGIL